MVDSADHITGKTGLTPTVTLSKNGGVFGSPVGTVSEIGNGLYKVAGNATDSATLGSLILHATATGADPVDVEFEVVAFDPQDSVRMGQTALPNVAAGALNGLPLSADTVGRVDVLKINGTSQTARDIGASVLLSSGTGTGQVNLSLGRVGINWADVQNPTTVVNLSGTTISTGQTITSVSGSVGSVTGTVTANTTQWGGVAVTGMPMPTYTQPTGFLAATFPTSVSSLTAANVWTTDVSTYATAGQAGTYQNKTDVLTSSRMATYTQPTGFLAATFPSTVASTTNITAASGVTLAGVTHTGAVIPTVTTVTNAVTAGTVNDKTGYSLAASQTFSTTGSVGSVTGSVSSVTGAVGSVSNPTSISAAVWDEGLAGHTVSSTFGGRILRSKTGSVSDVEISNQNHISATVHDIQAGVITASTIAAGAIDANAVAASAAQEIADTMLGRNIGGGSSTGRTVTEALRFLRNKFSVVSGTLTVYQEDDTTVSWTGTVGTTAGADPITSNDPA